MALVPTASFGTCNLKLNSQGSYRFHYLTEVSGASPTATRVFSKTIIYGGVARVHSYCKRLKVSAAGKEVMPCYRDGIMLMQLMYISG